MTWGRRLRRGCWELRLLLRPVDPNLEKDKEIKRQLDQYTVQYCTIYSEFTVQLSMQASQYMHFILRTWQKKAWSCSVEWYRQIQLKWANSKSQTSSALLRICQVTSSKPKSFCTITDLLTVTETPFSCSALNILFRCHCVPANDTNSDSVATLWSNQKVQLSTLSFLFTHFTQNKYQTKNHKTHKLQSSLDCVSAACLLSCVPPLTSNQSQQMTAPPWAWFC